MSICFFIFNFGVNFILLFIIFLLNEIAIDAVGSEKILYFMYLSLFISLFQAMSVAFYVKRTNKIISMKIRVEDWNTFYKDFEPLMIDLSFIPVSKIDNIYYFSRSFYFFQQTVSLKHLQNNDWEVFYPIKLKSLIEPKLSVYRKLKELKS